MKIEIAPYNGSTHVNAKEAARTREALSKLSYKGDSFIITDEHILEKRAAAKAVFNDELPNAITNWELQGLPLSTSHDVQLRYPYLTQDIYRIVFVATHVFAGGLQHLAFSRANEFERELNLLHAVFLYQNITTYVRKELYNINADSETTKIVREFLNVALMHPYCTSTYTDDACAMLLRMGGTAIYNATPAFRNALNVTLGSEANLSDYSIDLGSLSINVPLKRTSAGEVPYDPEGAGVAKCPWVDTPVHNSLYSESKFNFRHVFRTDKGPLMFGYNTYQDWERMAPKFMAMGKALTAMGWDNEQVKNILTATTARGLNGLKVVFYPNDIRFMEPYRRAHNAGTITSCMSRGPKSYGSGLDENDEYYHPLDPYSFAYFQGVDNNLALCTLEEEDGTILSRTIVNIAKGTYVRMYGSYKLARILCQMGIEECGDTLFDTEIALLRNQDYYIVGPYLDGDYDSVTIINDYTLRISDEGDPMRDTDGVFHEEGNLVCECCGSRMHEGEGDDYYIEEYGIVCEECYYMLTEEDAVDGVRYLRSTMLNITLDGRDVYVRRSNTEDLYYDDVDDVWYSYLDDMVATVEGRFTHIDNCVLLKSGEYVLSCNYDRDEHGPKDGDEDEEDEE